MAQLLPLTLAKLLLIMPPAEFLSHKKIDAPLHRNFRLAWLKYLIYTHRILILLINPIFYSHHLHIIGSLLTSVFLWALSQEVGIINFLLGNSLPFMQYDSVHITATCAITFNVASGQGPGYWDNIMDPVGTRS